MLFDSRFLLVQEAIVNLQFIFKYFYTNKGINPEEVKYFV